MRERFTAPDWHADGWFLERRHPTDWSRRTELVLPDHDQAKEADPLVGVHDELRLATGPRQGPFLAFLAATERAACIRTLESLARIELGAQGGALIERVTTTRTAKDGTSTTTVRERFTAPDWHADGWFLERRHPTDWSRRTELVLPDHDQAKEADPLVGVHDELRLARLARQKRLQ